LEFVSGRIKRLTGVPKTKRKVIDETIGRPDRDCLLSLRGMRGKSQGEAEGGCGNVCTLDCEKHSGTFRGSELRDVRHGKSHIKSQIVCSAAMTTIAHIF